MRVRRLTRSSKSQVSDTKWRTDDIQPRYCPVFARTRPNRAGWQWRSVRAEIDQRKFVAFALVNLRRSNFKSMLIEETPAGPSVIARYEFHGSHPGIHVHADCDRSGIETTATGMDGLARIPPANRPHRRTAAFSVSTFWNEARRFFGIETDDGPLFNR